jgi:hypothetical protein
MKKLMHTYMQGNKYLIFLLGAVDLNSKLWKILEDI